MSVPFSPTPTLAATLASWSRKECFWFTIKEEIEMLVLSRKVGERIMIGDNVAVVINRIAGNRVTVGIEAPDNVPIVRGELELVVRSFDDGLAEEAGEDPVASTSTAAATSPTMNAPKNGANRCGPRRLPGDFTAPLMAFRSAR